MRALVLDSRDPRVDVRRRFSRLPGEAQIRVERAGICATDLELIKGYMGFQGVLGHEWVGVVEEADDPAWVGQRVVGEINVPCGECATCARGRPTHCPRRTVVGIQGRDGAFAERLSLPTHLLHRVPDGVSNEAAVFVEPLAAACQILEQVHIRPSMRVVVLGLGRLGQLCARVLALTGAEVIGISRSPGPLAYLPAEIPGLLTHDAEHLPHADVVVDCTGSSAGLAVATGMVVPRGTVVLKSTTHDLGNATPAQWVIDEVTLVASRCGPFAPALRLLASGRVDPTPLITDVQPLSNGVEALRLAARSDVMKVLLDPSR